MSATGKDFISLVPPVGQRPASNYFGPASFTSLIRDNFSITTWLCFGAVAQSLLYLAAGRLALLPACTYLFYRAFVTYAMAVGWMRNPYMDGVLLKKFNAQFPDETGHYGSQPANDDVVVLLIGARSNHPMGLFAPGAKKLGDYFRGMAATLDAKADEFDYLGMTAWINSSEREAGSMLMNVGYFKSVEGLQAFAHSHHHREGWDWWNRTIKEHPHLSIYHEVYHAPKGHWESNYINSHPAGITSLRKSFVDPKTGEKMWASPVVDGSQGLLKTSAGRMSRSQAQEHEKYGGNPEY